LRVADLDGGVDGGVVSPVGGFPGEHIGMRLLGMADGEPRTEVLRVKCGGGVAGRLGSVGACSTMVAIFHVRQSSKNRCVIRSGRNVDCSVVSKRCEPPMASQGIGWLNNAAERGSGDLVDRIAHGNE
jgi:hypothetical protein